MSDLKTQALVFHRTNIGEADRLVDFATSSGKISALARGVRREKSKLAGGIEPFCLVEIRIHHSEKTNRNTLTGSRLLTFYQSILSDYEKLTLASDFLKKSYRATFQLPDANFFSLLNQSFSALNQNISPDLIKIWFNLNFYLTKGNQLNLSFDSTGEKLSPENTYAWNSTTESLELSSHGAISAPEIKLLRLITTSPLALVAKVKNINTFLPAIKSISETL
ncbi:MAG: DNA repair protein RecO [Candidatus Saccharibacteria bacterium]|nr:DNA repair protein RecO [Candidatus Saccharibacteria bacterium]